MGGFFATGVFLVLIGWIYVTELQDEVDESPIFVVLFIVWISLALIPSLLVIPAITKRVVIRGGNGILSIEEYSLFRRREFVVDEGFDFRWHIRVMISGASYLEFYGDVEGVIAKGFTVRDLERINVIFRELSEQRMDDDSEVS